MSTAFFDLMSFGFDDIVPQRVNTASYGLLSPVNQTRGVPLFEKTCLGVFPSIARIRR